MKTRRTFRKEFKRQVVEEVPSSDTNTIATCANIIVHTLLLTDVKKGYPLCSLNKKPTPYARYHGRIAQLE